MNITGNPSTAFDGQANEIIAINSIELKDKYIFPLDAPTTAGQVIKSTNSQQLIWDTDTAGTGDVSGPASAVNNNLCSFNGTTGKLIKDSGIPQASVYIKGTDLDMSGSNILNVNAIDTNAINTPDVSIARADDTTRVGITYITNDEAPVGRWFLGSDIGNDDIVLRNNGGNTNTRFENDGTTTITQTNDETKYEFKDKQMNMYVGGSLGTQPAINFYRSSNTISTPQGVGPIFGPLGVIDAYGHDNTSYSKGVSMIFETLGTWNGSSHPASLVISSSDLGTTTQTEKMRIDYTGIGIGEGEGAGTNGYLLPLTRGTTGQVLKLQADGIVEWKDDTAGGETFQDVYDNSTTTPQITTSIANGPLEIQQGVGAVNDLIRIRDSGGADVGSISSDGIYTDFGVYIGAVNSFNLTESAGTFQMAESGQNPFLEFAPDNLNLNKAGGLGTTTIQGGTAVISTLAQVNQLATNSDDGVSNIYRRSRGTLTTPTALVALDELTKTDFRGHDGTAYQDGAYMITRTPTGFGPSTRETDVELWTTPPTDLGGPQKNLTLKGTGQILAGKNKTAANPTYSFENHPTDGMYHTGFASVGIASQGQRILEVANAGAIIEDGKYVKLNSSSQDAGTANPVIITFIANGAYISGLIMKVVDVGGLPRVEPVASGDPDSIGVIGVSQTSSGIAGQSVEVAVGGTFIATPANGASVSIGDVLEKSDVAGQDGRVVATAPSAGHTLVALGNATGDASGSVKVLCMFKKNEAF